jgi:hypothetical protein
MSNFTKESTLTPEEFKALTPEEVLAFKKAKFGITEE